MLDIFQACLKRCGVVIVHMAERDPALLECGFVRGLGGCGSKVGGREDFDKVLKDCLIETTGCTCDKGFDGHPVAHLASHWLWRLA